MSFDNLLNKVCTIETLTETKNARSGNKEKSWTTYKARVKCRLDQDSAFQTGSQDTVLSKSQHVLFMRNVFNKPAENISTKQFRVIVGSVTYEVISVQDAGGQVHHLEIILDIFGKKN